MLVLSRHPQEKILIGDEIEITINWIKRDKVSIGIEAPRTMNIRRGEVPDTSKEKRDG